MISNDRACYDFVKANKSKLKSMEKDRVLSLLDKHSRIGLDGANRRNVDINEIKSLFDEDI